MTRRLAVSQREGEDVIQLTEESLRRDKNVIPAKPQQSSQEDGSDDTERCSQTLTCADPEADPQYTGNCPPSNCDNSQCKFRGCVHFGAFGPQWMPDPCTICSCHDAQELCTEIKCEESLECYGYPSRVKEGECCPSCDYGVSENECGVIPAGVKSLYTALGDHSCQRDVLLYGCDKHYFRGKDGKYYQCRAVETVRTLDMGEECDANVHQVTYMDTERCNKEVVLPSELPQDLDLEPRSCALYVEP